MKELKTAVMMTVLLAVLTGVAFPAVIWAVGQLLFPVQANGSIVRDRNGNAAGSVLLGQNLSSPQYFHPRPSAAGNGYDAANSGGTNLGPISRKLIEGIDDDPASVDIDESYLGIKDLAEAYRRENSLAPEIMLPSDAVTRSASGLDPHISPQNALLQAERVSSARGLEIAAVKALIAQHSEGRFLGLFGERRVNVLLLNLALDKLKEPPNRESLTKPAK